MAVKVAVIGCGSISQKRHIPELRANGKAELVAVCDINAKRAEEVAKPLGVKAFCDHRAMLQNVACDAVIVGTPNAFHAPQSIDAFEAGKHVLVEKPMAGTREEARAMIEAAKKAGKYLMIGLNQRLMPPHVKAKEILDAGLLGKVISFETTFKHPGPDGWSVDGAKSWFFKKPEAVMGVTGDLGVHKADLVRWLLGQEFVEAGGFIGTLHKKTATGEPISVDDNAVIALKTSAGVLGAMTISWTNYSAVEANGTTLYCENGVLEITGKAGVNVHSKSGKSESFKSGEVSTNTKQISSGVSDLFIDCILKKQPPSIDGAEGYKSLDVILTAMEAAAAGKIMKVGNQI